MGKSNEYRDKAVPRFKDKEDDEDFDWREELRKQEEEKIKARDEEYIEELHEASLSRLENDDVKPEEE